MKIKTINFVAVLCVCLLGIASSFACSGREDEKVAPTVYPVEDALQNLVSASGLSEQTAINLEGAQLEQGVAFSPKVKGVISAVSVKLPAYDNAVRVTIWDYETQSVLRTATVNVSEGGRYHKQAISLLEVEKGRRYVISMNVRTTYIHRKPDFSNAYFPIDLGSVLALHCRRMGRYGSAQEFPNFSTDAEYYGDLSFDFQQVD